MQRFLAIAIVGLAACSASASQLNSRVAAGDYSVQSLSDLELACNVSGPGGAYTTDTCTRPVGSSAQPAFRINNLSGTNYTFQWNWDNSGGPGNSTCTTTSSYCYMLGHVSPHDHTMSVLVTDTTTGQSVELSVLIIMS